ncbi:MAG: HNH endonuclease [Bdellovibrionaceae bacterium]|nr:HNH endonuclease [Pseudobdellovibrionaceae bacterium]
MTLKTLSHENLLVRLTKLVRTERKITHLVLECIAEVDRRRLYLERAYPSLFEYLTQVHGYSAGAAQRRISAARLLREIPEVAAKIEEGKLNLSQIALVTQNIKLAEKEFGAKMEAEDKRELLAKIESRSFVETQQILAHELKVEVPATERTQHHGDGSVTINMTLTKEEYESWCRVGELVSHSVPKRRHADLVIYLARKEISRRTEIKRASPQRERSSHPRQIAPNLRKRILTGLGVAPAHRKYAVLEKEKGHVKCDSDSTSGKGDSKCISDSKLWKGDSKSTSDSKPGKDSSRPNSDSKPGKDSSKSTSDSKPGKDSSRPNSDSTPLKKASPSTSESEVRPRGCGYVDLLTGKRCGSRCFLQIDHIHPVHAGGGNAPANLRALCSAHNRGRSRKPGAHPFR